MRQSKLFTKTRREAPKDEVSKNAELLIRAGYIHKEMAGVYTYLPFGLRVLKKIENIIREEINAIGGQEILMTTLQDPRVWKSTGRWSDEMMDNWFKTKLKNGGELGIANTHEEALTDLLRHHIQSKRDLPAYIYQFQTKFRNELRAKSGIMRGREFLMKDLYSFSLNEEDFKTFYEECAAAYIRIFKKVGLGDITYRTFASGGSFSKFSDEFQTVTNVGEDTIYINKEKNIAINKEVYTDSVLAELGLDKSKMIEEKSIEVGNIFPLGTRFSSALGLVYKEEGGQEIPVWMGSYGIGLGRVMGAVVEIFSDDKGIVWPKSLAPFPVHLISLPGGKPKADEIYKMFLDSGVEVLFDDRDISAGQKFGDSDLFGVPLRIVVSTKTLSQGKLELKWRESQEVLAVGEDEIIKYVKQNL